MCQANEEAVTLSNHILTLSPFSLDAEYHGGRRLSRFAAWLSADNWEVRSLSATRTSTTEAPHSAFISDPFGVWPVRAGFTATATGSSISRVARNRGWGRHLIPDPTIGWTIATLLSPKAHDLARWADVIVSSSPPESPHLAASLLARIHGKAHVMDMRDGWLDEPLRPELSSASIRARIEGRMEGHVARSAAAIIVTSPEWGSAFSARYPECARRVQVVRNAIESQPASPPANRSDVLRRWVYSGRFGGSRADQDPRLLLNPLVREALESGAPIDFRFVGALTSSEVDLLTEFGSAIAQTGSRVSLMGHVSHAKAIAEVQQADALLLLCASQHALPSKLFEYAATGKPIFAACREGSATWNACAGIKQAMRFGINQPTYCTTFSAFVSGSPVAEIDPELQIDTARRQLLTLMHEAAVSRTSKRT